MTLDENTQGNPICELCGNSGWGMVCLLYSDRADKHNSEPSNSSEDHYVCSECGDAGDVPTEWHFVR